MPDAVTDRVGHLNNRLGGRIAFGGDWSPEQWSREVWDEDVRLMREAGVNLVTVSPFGWSALEPQPGVFALDWLGDALDTLSDAGISACLATATASPPAWLARTHPESLPVTADGVRLSPGSRQHYCPNSVAYRAATVALAGALAQRFGDHPALAIWHINNEYGAHVDACYCDVCADAFRVWLTSRYVDITGLNAAWGTTFWSQRYGAFEEVVPPRRAPYIGNPAQQLDFRRFSSDSLLACFAAERNEVRRVTPDIPVTTNFMGLFKPLDYWAWADEEDIVSDDAYPDLDALDPHIGAALANDLMRSLRGGQPWMLMEQAPSAINWRPNNPPKPPGLMRLWSLMAVARGADAVMFFQWRASQRGAEKFHSAMVPHAGPDSRIFREVKALGHDLERLSGLTGEQVPADVCILLSWDAWWGLELDSHPTDRVRMVDQLLAYYRPFWDANVPVDLRPPDADLSAYRLVVAPNLYLVSTAAAERLEAYVEAGGHLVMSFFSGVVDEQECIHPGGLAPALARTFGIRLEEPWPLHVEDSVPLADRDGRTMGTGTLWSESLHVVDAGAVVMFATGDLTGRPAVTRRATGPGEATYLATRPNPELMGTFLGDAAVRAGVTPTLTTPDGVEAVRRGSALFVLNHTQAEVEIDIGARMTSLLDSTEYDGVVRLAPRGVQVLRA